MTAKGVTLMNGKLKDSNVDFLFKAVLALENIDECYDFLRISAP